MFQNREEAARLIAERLERYRGARPLVLAIPRGGVPMGRIVADALDGELDVVLVHKLGAPGNPEYAIGAGDENGRVELTAAAHQLGISQEYIEREKQAQLERIQERRRNYGRPPVDPGNRVTIVVDDGVATGSSLKAALGAVRAQGPSKLIAAVAVAPPEAAERLEDTVDELVCLQTPEPFFAVGQFFAEFSQVTDEEVIALLSRGQSQ